MKIYFIILTSFFLTFNISAQLPKGAIAFIGYNTDSSTTGNDNFSFITLNSIAPNTIIYFTDEGWDAKTNTWISSLEGHIEYKAPATGLPERSIVTVTESNTLQNTFIVSGAGGSATLKNAFKWWSLNAGDQVLAYQASEVRPTTSIPNFIAGIHADDRYNSQENFWSSETLSTFLDSSQSELPDGLVNGENCISLFPTPGMEKDNARYNGRFNYADSEVLARSINNRDLWIFDNFTAFDIEASAFPDTQSEVLSTPNLEITSQNNTHVTPNPCTNSIRISHNSASSKSKDEFEYTVYNYLGKKVIQGKTEFNTSINLENISSGVYFIQIDLNKTPLKFIKS